MNYKRISQLYQALDEEYKKTPLNQKRLDEINHYLMLELGETEKPPTKSFWAKITLPENWRLYITALVSALIAANSQLKVVPQNVQDALLAVAVALGFWAVNTTQNLNLLKMKSHLTLLMHRRPKQEN